MSDVATMDDAWILSRRGPRNALDPRKAYAGIVERERSEHGVVEEVATVFITNRECTYRCLMCDLWRNTTVDPVPIGSVSHQIQNVLADLPPVQVVKLYNAGSFFDHKAIAPADWDAIAALVEPHRAVIVEAHPNLVGEDCLRFGQKIAGKLQVAMGLETVDPSVLPRLNKRMTLNDFERAVRFLADHDMHSRAFILLRTPFQSESQGVHWAKESLRWAFDVGIECCTVIPTRAGNGAMDELAARGDFHPPRIESLEEVAQYGVELGAGRVFADLWDIERLCGDEAAQAAQRSRIARLESMNLLQRIPQ